MFRPKQLREESETIRASLKKRGQKPDRLDQALALDTERRDVIEQVEQLQQRRNQESEKIGQLKAEGKDDEAEQIIDKMSELKDTIQTLNDRRDQLDQELQNILLRLPNRLQDDVPQGETESDNDEIERVGEPPDFSFEAKAHWQLADDLSMINMEQAQKISGSRFSVYHEDGARLERALINFMLDIQRKENGYEEVMTPVLVREEVMEGTGQLPKFEQDMFKTDTDEFYLIPTAEVSLINLYREMILDAGDLPIKKAAWTPCFRREAGAHGRDTRGLMRQHQFNKVELVSITTPEQSEAMHQEILTDAKSILDRLELPYRTVILCSGDTGFAASKTFDLEVWLPGQQRYREISSISNCLGFQARRARIQYRPEPKKTAVYCHTLNGSGVAIGRCWLAIVENFQQEDGSITLPDALRPYLDGQKSISS